MGFRSTHRCTAWSLLPKQLVLLLVFIPKSGSVFDFVGLWEGIDPLDGANMQRSIVLAQNNNANSSNNNKNNTTSSSLLLNNYTITGRIEFSQICGGNTRGNITEEPNVTSAIIPASLRGFGQVVTESNTNNTTGDETQTVVMKASLSITCFGEASPRIENIQVTYQPMIGTSSSGEHFIMSEIPKFRANSPIYLFRVNAVATTTTTALKEEQTASYSAAPTYITTPTTSLMVLGLVFLMELS